MLPSELFMGRPPKFSLKDKADAMQQYMQWEKPSLLMKLLG